MIPRQWKVIQTVREKFSCRDCETITQPPAPFHVTPRGFAGPNLLAMILFEKFGQHQPLNRQSERYRARGHRSEPVDAGRPGRRLHDGAAAASCADRGPCSGRRAAARRRHHGADPGQGQDDQGPHLDLCPRRPAVWRARAAGGALLRLARPPAASIPARHLRGFTGILQADAYSGYNELYDPSRARRGRSRRHCAGPMRGGSSSSWPTSRPMPGAARTRRRSRRSRWRRSSASMRCSTSSATSMA